MTEFLFDPECLAASLRLAIPIAFAALGGMLCERSGVYNIGLEGLLLAGAFGAATGTFLSGTPWIGLGGAIGAGLATGILLAILTVTLGVDQFVSGIAVNLLMLGLTAFLSRAIFEGQANTTVLSGFDPVAVPGLSALPVIGPVVFRQDVLGYLLFLMIPLIAFMFRKATIGLDIDAIGEAPRAADAAGLRVNQLRFLCMVAGSTLASLGGCYLVLSQVFVFSEHMSAGKGFVALAAIILGRWSPVGVCAACLFFGFCDALQLQLQFSHPDVPYQAFVALPYVASIIALVGLAGPSARAPGSAGKVYVRSDK